MPSLVTQLLWDHGIVYWTVCAVVLALATRRRHARLAHGWVVVLLLATAVTGTVITWNTTGYGPAPGEVARLFLPVAVLSRIAVLLTLLMSVDALLDGRSSRGVAGAGPAPPPATG